jgi:hypothetical protein
MNEDALRALVREAVARHLPAPDAPRRGEAPLRSAADASHFRYTLPESDGPCLIEPTVACNHCGY